MDVIEKQETVTVTAVGSGGRGIATLPSGKKIFIPGVLPGESCDVKITVDKSSYAEGICTHLHNESPERVLPFGTAIPGEDLAHLSYEGQLLYKEELVKSCLIRLAKIDPIHVEKILRPILPSEPHAGYRDHMQYRISGGRICLTGEGTDTPVPADRCTTAYEVFSRTGDVLEEIFKDAPTTLFDGVVMRASESTHQLLIELLSSSSQPHEKTIRDTKDYISSTGLSEALRSKIPDYELNGILLRVSHTKTERRTRSGNRFLIEGNDWYDEKLLGRDFRIYAGSFFQVNIPVAGKIYSIAKEYVSGADILWDVYCGTGSIGICCASEGQTLIGIEAVKAAVDSAKFNASRNGLTNARFIQRPAENMILDDGTLPTPDVVILDPPRKGMDQRFTRNLIRLSPPKIVYISCDPATLARDLRELTGAGYDIISATPADMFPNTSHVETVVLMSRADR